VSRCNRKGFLFCSVHYKKLALVTGNLNIPEEQSRFGYCVHFEGICFVFLGRLLVVLRGMAVSLSTYLSVTAVVTLELCSC